MRMKYFKYENQIKAAICGARGEDSAFDNNRLPEASCFTDFIFMGIAVMSGAKKVLPAEDSVTFDSKYWLEIRDGIKDYLGIKAGSECDSAAMFDVDDFIQTHAHQHPDMVAAMLEGEEAGVIKAAKKLIVVFAMGRSQIAAIEALITRVAGEEAPPAL